MKRQERINLEAKYFKSKKELDIIRSNTTLLKWNILTEANKIGKQLWGKEFTIRKLSQDMGLPYTTTKRCLALDRATKRSWRLLKEDKISAFKLAMVCQLKSKTFQDEIVDAVIKDNLSTYQIKNFKARNIKDVNRWRHKMAIQKQYSRVDSAFRSFNNWIQRGNYFLLLPISSVGDKNKNKIIKDLKKLNKKIEVYLKNNGKNM